MTVTHITIELPGHAHNLGNIQANEVTHRRPSVPYAMVLVPIVLAKLPGEDDEYDIKELWRERGDQQVLLVQTHLETDFPFHEVKQCLLHKKASVHQPSR